jgi:hypothetical protein
MSPSPEPPPVLKPLPHAAPSSQDLHHPGGIARAVGVMYVLTMASALFGPFYVRAGLVVAGDAATTAAQIMAAQGLFRAGILSDLLTSVGCVVLAWALHELLRPVNRRLATLALGWRWMEISMLSVSALCGVVVLALLGDGAHLQGLPAAHLQVLAFSALRLQGAIYNVGLLFFGLGSGLFSVLLLRTTYVPQWLSAIGVMGSMLVVVSAVMTLLWPPFAKAVGMSLFLPIFLFEVTAGLWLWVKGAGRR